MATFLAEEHTMRHFRESWMPQNMIRTSYKKWADSGKKIGINVIKISCVKFGKRPQKPLSAETLAKLDEIMAEAEKRYQ